MGPMGAREGPPGPLGGSRRRVQGAAQPRPSPQRPVGEEAERQQARAQQVTQPCEAWDAVVVWVQGLPPRQPDRHVRQVQQDHHLWGERRGDGRAGGAAGLWLEVPMGAPSRAPCRPGSPRPEARLYPKPWASSTSRACQKPVWRRPVRSQASAPKPLVQAILPGAALDGLPGSLPTLWGHSRAEVPSRGRPQGLGRWAASRSPHAPLGAPGWPCPSRDPASATALTLLGRRQQCLWTRPLGRTSRPNLREAETMSCLSRDPSQAGARWPSLPGQDPPAGTGARRSRRSGPTGFLAGRRRRRRPSGRAPQAAAGRGPTWR